MNFPCIKCGLCCSSLQGVHIAVDLDRGDGVCKYLVESRCSIYENRPLVCNVEAMYLSKYKETMTEEVFVTLNLEACIKIAELHNEEAIQLKLKQVLADFRRF